MNNQNRDLIAHFFFVTVAGFVLVTFLAIPVGIAAVLFAWAYRILCG